MSKGEYVVQEVQSANKQASRDVSFRSCLCALLVFVAFCIIIIIVVVIVEKNKDVTVTQDDDLPLSLAESGKINFTEKPITYTPKETTPLPKQSIVTTLKDDNEVVVKSTTQEKSTPKNGTTLKPDLISVRTNQSTTTETTTLYTETKLSTNLTTFNPDNASTRTTTAQSPTGPEETNLKTLTTTLNTDYSSMTTFEATTDPKQLKTNLTATLNADYESVGKITTQSSTDPEGTHSKNLTTLSANHSSSEQTTIEPTTEPKQSKSSLTAVNTDSESTRETVTQSSTDPEGTHSKNLTTLSANYSSSEQTTIEPTTDPKQSESSLTAVNTDSESTRETVTQSSTDPEGTHSKNLTTLSANYSSSEQTTIEPTTDPKQSESSLTAVNTDSESTRETVTQSSTDPEGTHSKNLTTLSANYSSSEQTTIEPTTDPKQRESSLTAVNTDSESTRETVTQSSTDPEGTHSKNLTTLSANYSSSEQTTIEPTTDPKQSKSNLTEVNTDSESTRETVTQSSTDPEGTHSKNLTTLPTEQTTIEPTTYPKRNKSSLTTLNTDSKSTQETTTQSSTDPEGTHSKNLTTPNADYSSNDQTTIKPTNPTTSLKMTTYQVPVSTTILPSIITIPSTATQQPTAKPVCENSACKLAQSHILGLMNLAKDRCENFYDYVCGGLQPNDPTTQVWKGIEDQLFNITTASSPKYLKNFGTFYAQCMDYERRFNFTGRLNEVNDILKSVGSIMDENEGEPDLTDLFTKLVQHQSLPFFDVDVDVDNVTSQFVLKVILPTNESVLGENGYWSPLYDIQKYCLERQRLYQSRETVNLLESYKYYQQCQKDELHLYLESVKSTIETLDFFSNSSINFTERLGQRIEWDILDRQKFSLPDIKTELAYKQYTNYTISKLNEKCTWLNWKKMFDELTGRDLTNDTIVQLYFENHFTALELELDAQGKIELHNALLAMYAEKLYQTLVLPKSQNNRHDYCLKMTSELFPEVASSMYLNSQPKNAGILESITQNIFDKLKETLVESVQNRNYVWKQDETADRLIAKVKALHLMFNTQDDLFNNQSYLETTYGDNLLLQKSFQQNVIYLIRNKRAALYKLIGADSSADAMWNYFVKSYDIKPKTFYGKNEIFVPRAVLMNIKTNVPDYMLMARLGMTLAREIARHFDPVGIQHLLTQSTEIAYKELVIDQLSSVDPLPAVLQNQNILLEINMPKLSVLETIADNTAYRMVSDSFQTYSTGLELKHVSEMFSKEQLFHITVAQDYCSRTDLTDYMLSFYESKLLPPPLRVENIVLNSEQFVDTFGCPYGSKMGGRNPNQFPHQMPHIQSG